KEPHEPKSGQFYFDSAANNLKIYNGTSWVVLDKETAESIVDLINSGKSKIDKSKVDGLEEAINQASMTGQAIATALNEDTGGVTVNQNKITGLTDKLAEIATNKASATRESQDALQEAKVYADQKVAGLVDSASEDYNTFKELETFIKQNAKGLAAISNVAKKFSKTFGDARAKEFTITHNLKTRDVNVTIRETNFPYAIVYADIKVTDENSILIATGAEVLTQNQYTVTITG
ncbi:TPA: hypothetical protein ACJ7D2_001835, partial [Streptococcus pyogenes]|nr:hypothetical protein [Streptococcus pyogenes]